MPTYNERENLPPLVERLFRALGAAGMEAELIVVDDNSPDGTAAVAEALAARFPVRVLRRRGKGGLASAVLAGWRAAAGEVLGVIDADLSHPPEAVPALVAPILDGRADVAVGSRYVDGGGTDGWPLFRRLVSRGASLVARPLTPVRDPMSGFLFLRRGVIEGVPLNPRGFKIGLEVLVKGRYQGIAEVPYVFRNRQAGRSKLGAAEYGEYLRHAAGLYRSALARRGWAARGAAASAAFVAADVVALYAAVDLGGIPLLPAAGMAFLAALGLPAGATGAAAARRGRRLLLPLAAVAGMAFALHMVGIFALVVRAGLPYLVGNLLTDLLVVAPLLVAGRALAPRSPGRVPYPRGGPGEPPGGRWPSR